MIQLISHLYLILCDIFPKKVFKKIEENNLLKYSIFIKKSPSFEENIRIFLPHLDS